MNDNSARFRMDDAPFEPSGERGRRLDLAMRTRLAASLEHVFAAIGGELDIDTAAAHGAVAGIRRDRQSPTVFGAYYDLVLAVERDELGRAKELAAELIGAVGEPAPASWAVKLGELNPATSERYARLLLPETIEASDADPAIFASTAARIDSAMNLLDRGFPAMAEEIRALLYQIVIAVGPEDPKALTFDGSSSYMLWGAIMLNAHGQTNVLDTAQALAHESGHNLLFGFCTDGPLVENDDEEAFSHPLRQDPRPMDGVVHAAYVTARMHQTVQRLLESGALDEQQRAAARRDLELHQGNFAAADEVIRAHALLTPVGEQAMASARAQLAVPA